MNENIPNLTEEKVQQQVNNWIEEELERTKKENNCPEALKFEEGKITEVNVSIAKEWDKYIDPSSGQVKKILPITFEGKPRTWFLNCANPLYRQILEFAKNCKDNNSDNFTIKILRTGQMKNTRYSVVS